MRLTQLPDSICRGHGHAIKALGGDVDLQAGAAQALQRLDRGSAMSVQNEYGHLLSCSWSSCRPVQPPRQQCGIVGAGDSRHEVRIVAAHADCATLRGYGRRIVSGCSLANSAVMGAVGVTEILDRLLQLLFQLTAAFSQLKLNLSFL